MKRVGVLAALTFILAAPTPGGGADEQRFSDAEKRIFLTDQLANVGPTATLRYDFSKTGDLEENFQDKVSMSVRPSDSKVGKHVSVSYLTGERRLELPDIDEATGNPVTMFFLERDVREMRRITGGPTNYYRERIRLALAQRAKVQATTFKYRGREIQGDEISVEPYADDPRRARFAKYANKAYFFVLSDQVPGGVYQLRTVMKAAAQGRSARAAAGTLIEETLTFGEVGP
jgi:hypothetical protein